MAGMMTIDEMIEVLNAAKDGKRIQATDDVSGVSGWYDLLSPSWNFSIYSFRVKPEKKLRPWRPEEVPVGALARKKDKSVRTIICTVTKSGTSLGDYLRILHDWEHSIDNGKTWLPCGVEE